MPDEKISDLPLTPAVNLDDTFEKSRHNAAPSERMTAQQLVTFMQAAMASLSLNGGTIILASNGAVNIGKIGASGLLNLNDAGGNTNTQLLGDGTAVFANGAASITNLGVTTVAVLNVGPASIDNLGQALLKSLTMVDANVAILASGDMTLGGSTSAGSLQILDAVGGLLTKLDSDGTASFASGQATIGSDGSAVLGNGTSNIDNAGNMNVNTSYGVAGTQVVGAQQPAIADATNAVDVITQFNTLLAELRTHGLIAT